MKTKTSNWMRKIAGITAVLMVLTTFVGQASARILFQDDTVGVWESEFIHLGSNDAGATNTGITFGADGNAAENGNITWNITTNVFEFDNTVSVTGGLSATGQVDFSGAAGTRIRENTDPSLYADCTNVGEVILNTSNNTILICTTAGNAAVAATLTNQTITYTANTPGIGGNSYTITLAETAAADLGGNSATINVALSGNNITVTFQDDSNGVNPESVGQKDIVECINSAVNMTTSGNGVNAGNGVACTITNDVTGILTASGGTDSTDAVALAQTNLAGGTNSTAVWTGASSSTLDGLTSSQFLRSDTSDNFTSGTLTFDNGTTLTVNGVANIGDGGDSVTINSSTWDISAAGIASGFTGFTSTGVIDFSGASRLALAQGAANPGTCTEGDIFYNTTNNTTYICTAADTWTGLSSGNPDFETVYGNDADKSLSITDNLATAFEIKEGANSYIKLATTDGSELITLTPNTTVTGTLTANGTFNANGIVAIGDGGDTVTINSSSWDISAAGAASGFTTIDASGNITTSGGTFCVGGTCLNETTANNDSGAFIVGVFDEFTNSNSTNVQAVLKDFDGKIGSNAPNVDTMTFFPEYPDAVHYLDGIDNTGTFAVDYDNANREHYYRFYTSKNTLQDQDIRFRYELPADFVSSGNFTYRLRTNTTAAADNFAAIIIRNDTDNTTCHSDGNVASSVANTWETATITAAEINTGCAGGAALAPGDVVEVQIKLSARSTNSGRTDVGKIAFDYAN